MNEPLLQIVISQAWQIAALTIMVAGIVRIAAKSRPHLAHALWMLVLIKCVTPPLWAHSLGVFSQLQTLAVPSEVTAETEGVNPRVETIAVAERSVPEDYVELQVPLDINAAIAVSDDITELQFHTEPQRRDVTEEAPPQSDPASLHLSDSATEITLLQPEPATLTIDQPSSSGIEQLPTILFGGLIIGAIVTLMTMVIRCFRCLRQIRLHQTTEFDDVLRDRIQQLANQLRMRRIPRIIVSDVLFGPAVLGFLRHTIVLPRCLFEGVDSSRSFLPERTFAARRTAPEPASAQRRNIAVETTSAGRVATGSEVLLGKEDLPKDLQFLNPILAHELLHIRRGDLRTGTLQAIVQSLWWFHPAVWLCNRWLSREAERCCDEQVIAELGCTPAHYARSLLSVIECKHRLQPIPVFPGMKPVEITSQRLERIMSLKNGLKKRTPIWCWLMIVALAFVVLPGAVAKPSVDEVASNETNDDTEIMQKEDVGAQLPEFEGNVFRSDADLRKHLGELERADNIDQATMRASDCESIKAKYRNVGFFDVEVLAISSAADNPTNRRVRFEVKQGRRYKIREIRFEGNNRVDSIDLQNSSALNSGEFFSSYPISKAIARIRERYEILGLAAAAINPVPHFIDEPGVVDLVFEIDENPVANYSKKTYDVSDLLTRLEMEQGIPAADAKRQLHRVLETSVRGLYYFSEQPADAASRKMSIYLYGDELEVLNSNAVHEKIVEELNRFRTLGFKQFQVTARFIVGPAEEINTLMSSLKLEPPFCDIKETSVVEIQHSVPDKAEPGQSAVTTYHKETTGIVSREVALQIEELARSKTDCFIVERPQVLAFNGQTAVTPAIPNIVRLNDTEEAVLRTLIDGLTIKVTPTFVDDSVVRLQCVSCLEGVAEMQPVSISTKGSESPQSVKSSPIASRRVQTTVELRHDQTLFLSGITMPHNGKCQAVLVVLDAVPVSMKPLTSLIRLDESFTPSPETVLTGDAVLAYVADKKITVDDVANGIQSRLDMDKEITPEQRQKILFDAVVQRLPGYLYDEVVLHQFRRAIPPDKEAVIRASLDPPFTEILEKMVKDRRIKDTIELERMLVAEGFTIESMRESFLRRQFVVGYSQSMPAGSPIQNQAAIEAYCRQLLFEARLREKICANAKDSFTARDLLSLGKEHGISISRIGISDDDIVATRTTNIVDQPLLEVIKAIVEPHGFQVAVGKEEVVLTATPQDQPVAETPESAPLQNGDIIMVTRNGSAEAVQAKPTDGVKVDGIAVGGNSGLVGIFNYEEPREKSGVPDDQANSSTIQAATFERSVSPKWRENPGVAPKESATVVDRDMSPAIQQLSDPLVKQVWQMRESIRKRLLSTDQYTPWQLMQGLKGLRHDFVLKHDGKIVNGLEWIQTGPMFEDEPWFQKSVHGGQAHPYTKPYAFQGHINQFAAILADCNVPLDTQFGTPDGPITMEDLVRNAQMTVNDKEEVSWTLQLLCRYLPADAEWVNAQGEQWRIERLVSTTIRKTSASGAPDGGTFGLFALAVARREYLKNGKLLNGVWLDADKMIQKHIQLAHDQQNSNGILSSNFFRGHEEKKDFNRRLASSGALLEFLMMAASDEQLKEDWLRKAVAATAKDLDDNRNAFVSCSPLYRATNALSIFLDRISLPKVASSRPGPGDKPAKNVGVADQLVLATYPIADLVVAQAKFVATQQGAKDSTVNPSAETIAEDTVTASKAAVAPLIDLIKISIEPDTWGPRSPCTIAVDDKSLSLVIRQTGAVHDQIADLLAQLRKLKDQNVTLISADQATTTQHKQIMRSKPSSKEDSPEVLCSYPVADLLVYRHSRIPGVGGLAAAIRPADQKFFADQGLQLIEPKPVYLNGKADFAPLIELIKATVQPESWDPLGRTNITVEEETQSLVIRQTNAAHDEIAELLSQIRSEVDHTIYIKSLLMKLTDESQQTLIDKQCSLHSLENGTQWALLSKQRCDAFTHELLALKPDVLSRPQLITNSGQTAQFQVGQSNTDDDSTPDIKLNITPHLLPQKKVIRLQHYIQIGQLTTTAQLPTESLVGSGQTLMLLVDVPSKNKESNAATSKYLLMITPVYIPMVEEKEAVAAPHADTKAEANP